MKIEGKTVFITGGSSGIGLALTRAMAALGNTVIICGRKQDKLAAVKKELPDVHTIQCDVADDDQLRAAAKEIETTFGKLDILVNNAGIMQMLDFAKEEIPFEKIEKGIQIDLAAPIKLTTLLLPLLKKSPDAAVVNVTSSVAYIPYKPVPVYGAAKAGLIYFTGTLRLQLKDTTVKVFDVLPPPVNTGLVGDLPTPKMISPAEMARGMIKGLRKNRYEIRVGLSAPTYWMKRIIPGLTEKLMNKGL